MRNTKIPVTTGYCVGRNGIFDISGVDVRSFADEVGITGISKAKKQLLNSGINIDRAAAEKLGKALLEISKEK